MNAAIECIETTSAHIQPLRQLFLHENNFEFIYNKCHDYGWAKCWLFTYDGAEIGYGAIWGSITRENRDAVFEFYIIDTYRSFTNKIFADFCTASKAIYIEAQSNDKMLAPLLFQHAVNINAEAILFRDAYESRLKAEALLLRESTREDDAAGNDDEYVLLLDGKIIGGGGLMLNYNMPYADIYMHIKEPFRQKGYGSWLVQELKKAAYRMHRVPAARCNINNQISKSTLQKAGFTPCGFILKGDIKTS